MVIGHLVVNQPGSYQLYCILLHFVIVRPGPSHECPGDGIVGDCATVLLFYWPFVVRRAGILYWLWQKLQFLLYGLGHTTQ